VLFDFAGPSVPNTFPPSTGTAAFTVPVTGDYEFDFEAQARSTNEANVPIAFALFVNGLGPVPGTKFMSDPPGNSPATATANGTGTISLTAGQEVTLRNQTGSTVDFTSVDNFTINAALRLKLLPNCPG